MADNALKVSITDAIAIFFSILGVIGITFGVAIIAYFVAVYLPYYQERIETPIAIAFVTGVIAFIISCVYLSMIDITSTSVLQCYMLDAELGKGRVRYANERIIEIMGDE